MDAAVDHDDLCMNTKFIYIKQICYNDIGCVCHIVVYLQHFHMMIFINKMRENDHHPDVFQCRFTNVYVYSEKIFIVKVDNIIEVESKCATWSKY